MKNCKISARDGSENALFMAANNFKEIYLENVSVSGYNKPTIAHTNDGKIVIKNSGEFFVEKGINRTRTGE